MLSLSATARSLARNVSPWTPSPRRACALAVSIDASRRARSSGVQLVREHVFHDLQRDLDAVGEIGRLVDDEPAAPDLGAHDHEERIESTESRPLAVASPRSTKGSQLALRPFVAT